MIGGSAGGFAALVVYIFTHTHMLFYFLFFLKGQATAAICIKEKMKSKFIAKEIRKFALTMTVRVMCVHFFLSHCKAKTHKEERGKKFLD